MRRAKGEMLLPPAIREVRGPVLFLGGPIQDAPDWHALAIKMVRDISSDIIIASPRKDYLPGEFVYERQVDWETYYLNRAANFGAIMFWLAAQEYQTENEAVAFPRPYAQTTRQELGEWRSERKHDHGINLIVGIEPGFSNARYTRRRFAQDCPGVPIFDNLADTCRAAAWSIIG